MYIYMTSGTYPFLHKLKGKYPEETMVLMQSRNSTQLMHESSNSSLFQSPRKYKVIDSAGEFANEGFISCIYIPVRDEGRPIFEYKIENKAKMIEKEKGFIAMRILRPLSKDTYLVVSMWQEKNDYDTWKNSKSFANAHFESNGTNVFSGPSYTSTFIVTDEEQDELD